ncbi:hypothetical protein BCR43DRAFT_483288 [Syncephalastrum racemosum]|uniref:CDP-diacylglycerol--glycerol-3-phosphate 3-phosphatidyltransferase n=1 Tax=Syncephalastrum racemosum TaxID=13706 RepID=A0A1X2HV08_SYNRA|nr:hypothetical protein BCR43DRAFT_483288 [Syncephalastrum racemosum]
MPISRSSSSLLAIRRAASRSASFAAARRIAPRQSHADFQRYQNARRLLSMTCVRHTPEAFQPLYKMAPAFYARGSDIVPLYEPCEFYAELKSRILSAKRRIFLAALYIGHTEKELVETIREALRQSDTLQVEILIDCLRGTRISKAGESSATLLLSLIREFPDQVQVSLYHTPDLTGMLKRALPQRFNEGIGLMHLKLYGFDDTIMLSGANLSTDYFTNRQDRYILFDKQPDITNYYHGLFNVVRRFSYQLYQAQSQKVSDEKTLHPGYTLAMLPGVHDPVRHSRQFRAQARENLLSFIARNTNHERTNVRPEEDTVVLPVIQMGPFNIRQDELMTLKLLDMANRATEQWTIDLTSGYFNFTDKYKAWILRTKAAFRFLTAAPEANGFFNSRGVSRFLPPAYTWIEKQFYKQARRAGRSEDITIKEYSRPGWTYHAKGMWVSLPGENHPTLTMIGSPNFGHRSSERDLEAQAVVITKNDELRSAFKKEIEHLNAYSTLVSTETFAQQDRRVPYGVRVATAMIKTML